LVGARNAKGNCFAWKQVRRGIAIERLRRRCAADSVPTMSDVETWAFSDAAPWEVEIERLTWRADIDTLRERTRTVVPQLVRPRALPPVWRFAEASALIGSCLLAWALGERRRGGSISRT
jgi:hypothetical protein